jgi:protein-disulfide isomerase
LGDESQWAAEAAECAGDQNKFWEFHDTLFSHQNGENQGAFTKDKLKGFAADLGLDTAAFNNCFDSGKYTEFIKEQGSIAQQIGVSSTPTFVINGNGIQGAPTFDSFKQTIDALLNPTTPTP